MSFSPAMIYDVILSPRGLGRKVCLTDLHKGISLPCAGGCFFPPSFSLSSPSPLSLPSFLHLHSLLYWLAVSLLPFLSSLIFILYFFPLFFSSPSLPLSLFFILYRAGLCLFLSFPSFLSPFLSPFPLSLLLSLLSSPSSFSSPSLPLSLFFILYCAGWMLFLSFSSFLSPYLSTVSHSLRISPLPPFSSPSSVFPLLVGARLFLSLSLSFSPLSLFSYYFSLVYFFSLLFLSSPCPSLSSSFLSTFLMLLVYLFCFFFFFHLFSFSPFFFTFSFFVPALSFTYLLLLPFFFYFLSLPLLFLSLFLMFSLLSPSLSCLFLNSHSFFQLSVFIYSISLRLSSSQTLSPSSILIFVSSTFSSSFAAFSHYLCFD